MRGSVIFGLSHYLLFLVTVDSATSYPIRLSQPLLRLADPELDSSIAAFSAVNSVQACPYDRDLLLVGGCDNAVKVSSVLLVNHVH